jgi:hypothetical protein
MVRLPVVSSVERVDEAHHIENHRRGGFGRLAFGS